MSIKPWKYYANRSILKYLHGNQSVSKFELTWIASYSRLILPIKLVSKGVYCSVFHLALVTSRILPGIPGQMKPHILIPVQGWIFRSSLSSAIVSPLGYHRNYIVFSAGSLLLLSHQYELYRYSLSIGYV